MELLKFFPKKEVALLNHNARLENSWGGIEDMPRIPDVMRCGADPHKEQIAVKD